MISEPHKNWFEYQSSKEHLDDPHTRYPLYQAHQKWYNLMKKKSLKEFAMTVGSVTLILLILKELAVGLALEARTKDQNFLP